MLKILHPSVFGNYCFRAITVLSTAVINAWALTYVPVPMQPTDLTILYSFRWTGRITPTNQKGKDMALGKRAIQLGEALNVTATTTITYDSRRCLNPCGVPKAFVSLPVTNHRSFASGMLTAVLVKVRVTSRMPAAHDQQDKTARFEATYHRINLLNGM